jgi:diguanylate cyclase (GGDEF)-like protein
MITEGSSLAFFTSHQCVSAYIDDDLIYSFQVPEGARSKTPGNGWHFIKLNTNYNADELTIVLTPSYTSVAGAIPSFSYGDKSAFLSALIKDAMFPTFLCAILFFIGIAVIFTTVFFKKTFHIPLNAVWLGVFSCFLAIWSSLESQMFPLFLGNHLLFNQLTFICLKMMLIPIMLFLQYIYCLKHTRFLDLVCIASLVDIIVTVCLQIFGIYDFRQTLIVDHIVFGVGCLWVITITLYQIITKQFRQREDIKYHFIGFVMVAVCVMADSVYFYYYNPVSASRFTNLGFLVYIIMLIIILLNNAIQLIRMGERAEQIQEIAYKDALTKLGNRSSYEASLSMLKPEQWINMSVAVFDLNNLKYFNDVHGHSMGDYYIIISSEVIQDIFGTKGTVFRTGGDEFYALLDHCEEPEFNDMLRQADERIVALSHSFFDGQMSLASGFAKFDSELDESFSATIQRADRHMYEQKEKMKKERGLPLEREETV